MSVAVAAAVRLDLIDRGELLRAQKSASPTLIFPSSDSSPTLSTSFQKVSSRFGIGNNPAVEFDVFWTKGSGTILTLAVKTSKDDGVLVPYEFEPSVGAASSGSSAVDIAVETFAAATWIYSGSPSATIAYLKYRLSVPVSRFVELWAKSDAASGTIAGYASAGTQG